MAAIYTSRIEYNCNIYLDRLYSVVSHNRLLNTICSYVCISSSCVVCVRSVNDTIIIMIVEWSICCTTWNGLKLWAGTPFSARCGALRLVVAARLARLPFM